MIVYRISGEGLLALVRMAVDSPGADPDMIFGILMGADREIPEPQMPGVAEGPSLIAGPEAPAAADKPAKPE